MNLCNKVVESQMKGDGSIQEERLCSLSWVILSSRNHTKILNPIMNLLSGYHKASYTNIN